MISHKINSKGALTHFCSYFSPIIRLCIQKIELIYPLLNNYNIFHDESQPLRMQSEGFA